MKTNPVWLACFLLAGFASLAISGAGGQEPGSPEARRKALEAERRKVTRRMAEVDVEMEKLKSAGKPGDVVAIEGFLGIAADFSVYAKWEADGLVFAELNTNKKLPAPAWDRDWGLPRAVLFGAGFVAVPAGKDSKTRSGQPVFTPADSVKIFSSKTLELERNFREFNSAAILADDGRVVAVARSPSEDSHMRSLVLQNIAARKVTAQMNETHLYSLAAAGKHVAFYQGRDDANLHDGRMSIVNAQTGTVTVEIKAGPSAWGLGISYVDARLPLAVSPSGNLLAWPDDDVVIIYDVRAAKILHRLVGHLDALRSLSFSAAGDILASSAKDKTVRFWNPTTGEPLRTIKHFPAVVTNVVLAPDGKRLLAVMGENRISTKARAEVRNIDLAQQPDAAQAGRKTLEAERDKLVQRLGEIDAALTKLTPAVKPGEPVVIEGFLGISADFSVYAAWDVDSLAFMELDTNKRLPAPPWETGWGPPRDVLFGANFVAVHANTPPIKFKKGRDLRRNPTVKIFSRKTLEMERNFRGPITDECVAGGNVLALLIDYDGERGKRLVLHDIKSKKQVAHIGLDQNYVYSLADGGKYFAFGRRHFSGKKGDGQVTILDAETGKVTAAVTIPLAEKMLPRELPLAVSADGARLAWADDDVAVLYDVKAAKVLHRLEGHLDAVSAVTFSPSGDFLVTSARDKTVRFWSTATGKSVHTIKNLPAAVSAIVLAPDGKRILTVSGDSRNPAGVRAEIRNIDLK